MFKRITEGNSLFKKNPDDKEDKLRKLLIEAKYYLAIGEFESYGDVYDLIERIESFLSQEE